MATAIDPVLSDALQSVPTRTYLMTSAFGGTRAGLVVHSVQRVADEPVLLCVAAERGHAIDPLIRDSRTFALGVIGEGDAFVRRRFAMRVNGSTGPCVHVEGDDPFDALQSTTLVTGSPLLEHCTTWFDCELVRRLDLETDHELFVGQVLGVVHNGATVRFEDEG